MNLLAGIGNGWMTPMVPVLMADDSPTGPLTAEEISWISSSFSLGSVTGGFVCSWLTAIIGSKRSSTTLLIPCMAFIFTIYFGTTFAHMVMSRIFAGLVTGGVQSNIVIYTSEIANDEYDRHISVVFGFVWISPQHRLIVLLAYLLSREIQRAWQIRFIRSVEPLLWHIGVLRCQLVSWIPIHSCRRSLPAHHVLCAFYLFAQHAAILSATKSD